jgi:hypothetical protein
MNAGLLLRGYQVLMDLVSLLLHQNWHEQQQILYLVTL